MSPTVLRAVCLTVRYGAHTAVEGVDLALSEGKMVALVGRNGAGKSSLLRALAGLIPFEGEVVRNPEVRLAYVPQRAAPRWDLPICVRQAVAAGRLNPRRWWRRPDRSDRMVVEAVLDRLGLRELAERPVGCLSGGQAQRLLLARALAQEPAVLLLDEPFDSLDQTSVVALVATLRQATEAGVAVCCALHELHLARRAFDRVVAIDRVVLADGPSGGVLPDQEPPRVVSLPGTAA